MRTADSGRDPASEIGFPDVIDRVIEVESVNVGIDSHTA